VTGCQRAFSNPNAVGPLPLRLQGRCAATPQPNPTAVANSAADCDAVLGTECDRIRRLDSERILRHEQFHMTLGCVLAQKGTALPASTPPAQHRLVLNVVRQMWTQLGSDRGLYDRETDHGCNAAEQARWEADILAGLPAHPVTLPAPQRRRRRR
jgi:hypothetical protein